MAVGLAFAGSAGAAPITLTDVEQGPRDITPQSSYSFQHVLSEYLPGLDTLISATLTVELDDGSIGNAGYRIRLGTGPQVFNGDKNSRGSFNFDLDAQSLAGLSATGTLDVVIAAKSCSSFVCGDNAFRFVSSTLNVDATRTSLPLATVAPPTSVPEPGTLSLLGLGLAAVAAMRGRRLLTRSRSQAQTTMAPSL